MADISQVFYNAAATNSVSLSGSGVQSGDYIIVFAWRNSTSGSPTLLTGYTSISVSSGNTNSYRVMYKVATGSETTTGTNSATVAMSAGIYRNVTGIGNFVASTAPASTTLTIPSFALSDTSGNSWVVQIGYDRNTGSQGNFATYTTRGILTAGASGFGIFGDTNAGITSYSGDTSANGMSATYSYAAIELLGTGGVTTTAAPTHMMMGMGA